ncbi:MAG: PIN domain-containing protein [Spirochaetes bacterium]|nr:PIN domain-containing protein [Spirochaetota bacterium]
MFSVDSNILIYSADGTSPFHDQARKFLDSVIAESTPIFLCWEVLHAYFRITTSPRIFKKPMSFQESKVRIQPLLSFPQLTMLSPSRLSFELLSGYADRIELSGNLVTDAVIASQLEANGIRLIYSHDADFGKFPYLKVKNPLQ